MTCPKGGPHEWMLVFRGKDYTVWKCQKCDATTWHDKQGAPPK